MLKYSAVLVLFVTWNLIGWQAQADYVGLCGQPQQGNLLSLGYLENEATLEIEAL
jgi:hypothetical protein